jgi:hypothetical protein
MSRVRPGVPLCSCSRPGGATTIRAHHARVTGAALPARLLLAGTLCLPPAGMLINLLPDFFTVIESADRAAAYQRYFDAHRRLLEAYWHNYVVDPNGPHFADVVQGTIDAARADLRAMLARTDVVALARTAEDRCARLLEPDVDIDVVLMVGVGAANAGELVVGGRAIAFVCLEHFTGIANPDTQGLGLEPELIPLWLAHEITHGLRYTSPTSRSELRQFITRTDGYYSYWETGRQIPLRELIVNEGLAVRVSQAVSPGHAASDYFGYEQRQHARVRELESVVTRAITPDLDRAGLGLRLRYLSGGISDEGRMADRYILPERSGYYYGARLVEPAIDQRGFAWAVRASAAEISALAQTAAASA